MGNPIPAAISVIDKQWTPLGDILTEDNGTYDVTVPGRESLSVSATPLGLPQHFIEMEGGYRISRYFELIKAIVPASESIELNFVIPPASALRILAYSHEGARMQMGEFNEKINPSGFYGYQGVYGAFPMDSFSLPVPTGASIGMFRAASHPEKEWSQWEPCFAVPPGEAVYLMMLWEVPGIGSFPLRADNQGQGYDLSDGEVRPINLVYEFAETEYRRATEIRADYEAQGYHFSTEVLEWLGQASADLDDARSQTYENSRALLSYEVLRLSIKAREHMMLEVAEVGIAAQRDDLTVIVQDEAGDPVPGAIVTYSQNNFAFVLGYAQGHPANPFPYPSFHAGQDIGYESLYGVIVWSKVSPQKGVYDFSTYDSAFKQWKGMGYETNACLAWLGSDNVPAWAQALEFTEFKQQVSEFVKKAVEHFDGTVKYLNIVVEPTIQTIVGSRYVNVEFESSYLMGVQPAELIELIRTVFEAAREVDAGIPLGYSAVDDFVYNVLNPLPFGAWPCSYPFLKAVLESGVRPDYIAVETYPGTGTIPLDLATVAAMIQAYHDLSGLPVLISETISYPSRAEDYGEIGPTPDVYWHEGMTQRVQAEWETSFFKIAMGLPYVLGVQMFRGMPDNPQWDPGQPLGDCMGIPSCIGNGTDSLTQDYQPKQVYYAMKDLIDSWKAHGAAMTGPDGRVSFQGLAGTYSIAVTTTEGLLQTVETHFGAESKVVTVTVDRAQAIDDLQRLVSEAQRKVDWSQNLGRQLDYSSLRSRLEEARSAMAGGDYEGSRSVAQQVLDTIAIRIDGNPDDWTGIPPTDTTPPGGVLVDAPGIDLKSVYGTTDDEYLYLMLEVYDPPIRLQPGGIDTGGISHPLFGFSLRTGAGGDWDYHVGVYLPYTGQIDVYDATGPGRLLGTLYSVAYGQVLELKVPLALLDNPSRISVCAYVMYLMAEEDGERQGAKGFPDYSEVLYPAYTVYFPVAASR